MAYTKETVTKLRDVADDFHDTVNLNGFCKILDRRGGDFIVPAYPQLRPECAQRKKVLNAIDTFHAAFMSEHDDDNQCSFNDIAALLHYIADLAEADF